MMNQINYVVSESPEAMRLAAQLLDARDDNAHPLDHDMFMRSRAVILATTATGEIVGCAAIKAGAGIIGELGYLIISPQYRRQGIAQALTVKRIEEAKALGILLLFATIRDENQASKKNLLRSGFHFWRNYYSIRGTGNIVGWYYLALYTGIAVDDVMQSLVAARVLAP